MNNAVQDMPDNEHNGIRDTGFPEPLSTERNTTLPHPDADTSPTASIEASDVSLNRTSSRLRFHLKHSKATSKGQIDPDHMYDNITYQDSSVDLKSKLESGNGSQLTKDSSFEFDGTKGKISYEGSSGEIDMPRRGEGETGSQKKKRHFLKKLRKH